MKRIIALLLAFCITAGILCMTASCAFVNGTFPPVNETPKGDDANQPNGDDENDNSRLTVPEYKDYQRGTVNFDQIEYTRPDFDGVIAACAELTSAITENKVEYSELHDAIWALDEEVVLLQTMVAFAELQSYMHPTDGKWFDENSYIGEQYPLLSQSYEKLMVAAANSPHAQNFEDDCFGEGFTAKYKDGGKYTDELVALMADEAECENEYTALSTATVEITYNDKTDTVDNLLYLYRSKYGENTYEYIRASKDCLALYEYVYNEKCTELLITLLKIRKQIANELGYDSYRTYAYETLYHDYTEEQGEKFLENIKNYIIPVFTKLSQYTGLENPTVDSVDRITLINNSYGMLAATDSELAEIYAYMLQHGLHDVKSANENRFSSFTTYLNKYKAPFLFLSTAGDAIDYTVMMHEFGHFADLYINDGESSSLDLAEVSSQALEFLMLTKLDGIMSKTMQKSITDYQIYNALLVLVYQGIYAEFENRAYKLDYEDITKQSVGEALGEATEYLGFTYVSDLEFVNIPHIMLYPFYVQSYCTSLVASLEIYFKETEESGAGFEIYKKIIDRGDKNLTFEEHLTNAGVESPFADGVMKKIANGIYRTITGCNYFKEENTIPKI